MAIAEVRTHRLSVPMHTPFVTALRRATTVEKLAAPVIDTDGRSGFGEVPQVWQVTAKCAGFRPATALLALAEAHGMGTIVGTMMESPIGVGAAASLVAAYGTTAVSDLDAAWWLANSPVQGACATRQPPSSYPRRLAYG